VKLELTIQSMPESARLLSTAAAEQRVLDDPNDPQRKLIRTLLAAVNEYDRWRGSCRAVYHLSCQGHSDGAGTRRAANGERLR
jgi:hypothetical protein